MSRFFSYISSAVRILETYEKGLPLSHHLKSFFAKEKKYGSRDRKTIGSICYHYFRCEALFGKHLSINEKILQSIFICENNHHPILQAFNSELNEQILMTTQEKLVYLKYDLPTLCKFSEYLSPAIELNGFALSFLIQPDLFLRIRPGKESAVLSALNKNGTEFELIGDSALRIKNGSKIDEVLRINKEVVIQDLNSQKVLDKLLQHLDIKSRNKPFSVWDTCAASGGKSILINDLLKGSVRLTVSDIRDTILKNLQIRLSEARVTIFHKFSADLTKENSFGDDLFDLIICDAPCSGSGTWSRTPEQQYSFEINQLDDFVSKQQKIISNVLPYLDVHGFFVYITCSVFAKENEEQVAFIQQQFALQLLDMRNLIGYYDGADTMFVAVFKKVS